MCFQDTGKYCVRRIALNNVTSRQTTLSMLQGTVGNTIWAGALPTLRPRMAFWTSLGLVSLGSLAGSYEYARIASSTTSLTAGTDESFTGWN